MLEDITLDSASCRHHTLSARRTPHEPRQILRQLKSTLGFLDETERAEVIRTLSWRLRYGWTSPKKIPVCYKYDDDKENLHRTCILGESYIHAPIVGVTIYFVGEESCTLGWNVFGDSCLKDKKDADALKAHILARSDLKLTKAAP